MFEQMDIFGKSTALDSVRESEQLSMLSADQIAAILYPPQPDLPVLRLNLKREYFEAIKNCEKFEEYRLVNEYWSRKLVGKQYSRIEICLGYPKKGDESKTLIFPYRGYVQKKINHPHFGDADVWVYAITLSPLG